MWAVTAGQVPLISITMYSDHRQSVVLGPGSDRCLGVGVSLSDWSWPLSFPKISARKIVAETSGTERCTHLLTSYKGFLVMLCEAAVHNTQTHALVHSRCCQQEQRGGYEQCIQTPKLYS